MEFLIENKKNPGYDRGYGGYGGGGYGYGGYGYGKFFEIKNNFRDKK